VPGKASDPIRCDTGQKEHPMQPQYLSFQVALAAMNDAIAKREVDRQAARARAGHPAADTSRGVEDTLDLPVRVATAVALLAALVVAAAVLV
jgi:hypothetical protein